FRDQCAGSAARGGFLCLLESGADYSLSGLPQSNDRVREDWSVSPVRKEDLRVVDSPQNASVRRARALERDRALRERLKTYVAWGRHIALEALASRATISQAFVGPGPSAPRDSSPWKDAPTRSGAGRRAPQWGRSSVCRSSP